MGERSKEERGNKASYVEEVSPFALRVSGADELVEGRKFMRRFEREREPHVRAVHKVIDECEHLDVMWRGYV